MTTLLDVAGLILLVAASYLAAGPAAAVFTAGVACLVASWSLTRAS